MADIAVAAVIRKAVDIAANLVIEEGSLLYWLPNLQTLSNVPGECIERLFVNRRKLNLSGLNLSGYQNIHKLRLDGGVMWVPRHHIFPQNLTKLVLENCNLGEDLLEHLKNLPKLKFLKLASSFYKAEKMMCSYGGADAFPQLQVLDLDRLFDLEEISVEEGGMPSLKELRVRHCPKLTKIPNRLRDITIHY